MSRRILASIFVIPAMALAGQGAAQAASATAPLQTLEGAAIGAAIASFADHGVAISLSVEGLEPGVRGVHVHETGLCEAPDFESAGDHWNPADAQHGLENPQGPHAGDLPNLTVGEDGKGKVEFILSGTTLDGLLDADGAAFVVHAAEDDQVTDPAGNSGDRIACGVFARD